MKKNFVRIVGILIIITTLFINGCGQAATPTSTPDTVNVQLSWFHGVEYAGFYAALEKGYYTEENIIVNLSAGDPRSTPLMKSKMAMLNLA